MKIPDNVIFQLRMGMLTVDGLNDHYLTAAAMWLQFFCPVLNVLSLSVTDLKEQLVKGGLLKSEVKRLFRQLDKAVTDAEVTVTKNSCLDFRGENMKAYLDFQDGYSDTLNPLVKSLYWAINLALTKQDRYKHVEPLSQASLTSLIAIIMMDVDIVLHKRWQEMWNHSVVFPWETMATYQPTKIAWLGDKLVSQLNGGTKMNIDADPGVATAMQNLVSWLTSPRVARDAMDRAIDMNPEFADKVERLKKDAK